jgi:hypothetical protein
MPEECTPEVVRYRNLARELAAQRKATQAVRSKTVERNAAPAAGRAGAVVSPRNATCETAPRGRLRLELGKIGMAFALLTVACVWLIPHGSDLGGIGDAGETSAAAAAVAKAQESDFKPGATTVDDIGTILRPLEAAVIASTAQDQAVQDLRRRLRAAEDLSATYASMLAQERAHSQLLGAQLAANAPPVQQPPEVSSGGSSDPQQAPAEPEAPIPASVSLPVDVGRLISRAAQLREQGDIAAARAVLESSVDDGHGAALFALAETYDPIVLAAWKTLGTKPDVAKARELYSRAEAAGVIAAVDRLNSLPP